MPRKTYDPEYQRAWRLKSPNYHLNTLINGARRRASRRGVPFDLTTSDLVIPLTCPVLGIPISHQKGGRQSDNSPSLDRLVPELGYVRENVRVVSFRANRIKNDASLQELEAVVRYIRDNS